MFSTVKEELFTLRGGAAGIIVLSIIVSVIAIATTGWTTYHFDDEGYRVEQGLWETCRCSKIQNEAYLDATRSMVIMGFIFTVASAVLSIMFMCVSFSQNRLFLSINLGSCIGAAVMFLVGVAVYGGYKGGLSYSYAFIVLAMLLNITAAGINISLITKSSSC